ncbi:hypothetical protein MMC30_000977 [Trapelia coarctata]|nr:hypothetical protein [Trapelia coarctata]
MLPYTVLLLTLSLGLAVARPKHAFLHQHKRTLTPDNTCGNIVAGNNKGYTCDPSDFWGGGCCSQYGYCGNSPVYCGTGCQSAFGVCDSGVSFSSVTTTNLRPLITFTGVATPLSTTLVSTTFSTLSTSTSLSSTSSSTSSTTSSTSTTSTSTSSTTLPTTTSSTSTTTTSTTSSSTAVASQTSATPSSNTGGGSAKAVQSGCLWVVPDSNSASFTHTLEFDFTQLTEFPSGNLTISNYDVGAGTAPHSQKYTPAQVAISEGTLQLKVPGGQNTSPIHGSEVQTAFQDILYGSVRTTVQVSDIGGTCHGMFYYKDDNQETDIEILTADLSSGAHYTNQPNTPGQMSTTATHPLPANATVVMHEHRLDWLPGQTVYYLDGVQTKVLTSNVPSDPGSWLWNNWSNGDPKWSAGPPEADSILKIEKIVMYFNRTGSAGSCGA